MSEKKKPDPAEIAEMLGSVSMTEEQRREHLAGTPKKQEPGPDSPWPRMKWYEWFLTAVLVLGIIWLFSFIFRILP